MNPKELADRLLEFAVRAGKVVDALPDTRMGRHVAGQLVRPPRRTTRKLALPRAGRIYSQTEDLPERIAGITRVDFTGC